MDAVLSYCHYSLNDSTLTDLIPYLKRKGVGIINASVLSMGLLTKYVGCPPCLICRQPVSSTSHFHFHPFALAFVHAVMLLLKQDASEVFQRHLPVARASAA